MQTRAALESWFEVVVVVFLVLALVGGWVAYGAHVDPGTTTEERTVSSWATTGTYTHQATVTEPNPVYDRGTTLENRSVYLLAATPDLDGQFAFSYNATDGGSLDVDVEEALVVRAVDERQERTAVVWEQSRTLETRTESDVAPGSRVTVPFSLDVNRTQNRTEQISERLGNPPGEPRVLVVTTVQFSGTVNGQAVNRTAAYAMPITFSQNAYRVNASADTTRDETTALVEVPREPGMLRTVGGPLLFGVGFLGLAALTVARSRNDFELSQRERDLLAYRGDRAEFDEWVTSFDLPPEALDLPRAEATSLADLVDFAIDTDNSVVENPGSETFYVRHDGVLYTYEAPPMDAPENAPTVDGSPPEAELSEDEGAQ
ncbi:MULTISPECIES: DUF5305 domain-containing protein [Haloarcula]|uniref:DUF5305 domain-containing protein n=1 Tax=Haloarcula TaxID=2237 RepID=UPI0023ED9C01|nr:DUF5305 domain-containing protein [Halomicroarcula sp. XH51]